MKNLLERVGMQEVNELNENEEIKRDSVRTVTWYRESVEVDRPGFNSGTAIYLLVSLRQIYLITELQFPHL